MGRIFATRRAQAGWFLAFALLTRISVFGDPNYLHDELFYAMVGQRMHDGLLPYIDLWDRKGPGLFLLFYLFAGISSSVFAYQIAAWLFAAGTALVIAMIAEHRADRLGATLAGTLYLAMLTVLGSGGGQSPVFYNLFIALAVLAVVRAMPLLREGRTTAGVYLAMGLAGFAITFKQTAFFESAYVGLYVLWQLRRGGMASGALAAAGLRLALAGAAPMLAFAGFYALAGYFDPFWHAMVTSNLAKTYNAANNNGERVIALTLLFSPLLLPALGGMLMRTGIDRLPRGFVCGWFLAGMAGVVAVPNFFEHYLAPLAVPAAVIAAPALGFRLIGPAFALAGIVLATVGGPAFDFREREASRQTMAALVRDIRAREPQPRLLVYEGPVYLQALLGSYHPSPLFYPLHLYHPPENDTSYLDTGKEMARILAWKPNVVITFHDPLPREENSRTGPLVRAYLRQCRLWFTRTVHEAYGPRLIDVFGDCAAIQPPRQAARSSSSAYLRRAVGA